MFLSVLLFLLCAATIYFACEYFVNGIEWVGRRLNVGATTTGTVLAAFGTALPESAVTFVAVVFGVSPSQKDIGVGAAVGGPLVLATISYAVVGVALVLNRHGLQRTSAVLQVDGRRLSRDQVWFLVIFSFTLVLGTLHTPLKGLFGAALLGAYAIYVWREMRRDDHADDVEEELEPLKIRQHDSEPRLAWAFIQTLVALIVIAIASRIFVGQLEVLGNALGLSAHVVALLLSPVATELPETLNALIWVRQGRERLALANISGAMMIQATVPAALGVMFTPWQFDANLLAAGIITCGAVLMLFAQFRRSAVNALGLIPVCLLYVLFAAIVVSLRYLRSFA